MSKPSQLARRHHARWFPLALLVLLAHFTSASASDRLVVSRPTVTIECSLTIGGSFVGRTDALTGEVVLNHGEIDFETIQFRLDLSDIDTGIALRNRHLRDNYLEVERGDAFRIANLSKLVLAGEAQNPPAGDRGFTAELQLHGTTGSVTGNAKIATTGDGFTVTVRFPLDLTTFAIAKPRHLGVGVKDLVAIEVSFALVPAPGEPK